MVCVRVRYVSSDEEGSEGESMNGRLERKENDQMTNQIMRLLALLSWLGKFFLVTSGGWLAWIVFFYNVPVLQFLRLGGPAGFLLGIMHVAGTALSAAFIWIVSGRNLISEILGIG